MANTTDELDATLLDFSTVGDYARDDHRFQEQARTQEAHDWIVGGFAKTIDKLPGIAWGLAEQPRDMASRKK